MLSNRRTRRGAAAALSVVCLAGSMPPAVAASTGSEEIVDASDVPMLGTFAFNELGQGDRRVIHGAVHGVRRLADSTVVYYSVGQAVEGVGNAAADVSARDQRGSGRFVAQDVIDLGVIVAPELVQYEPLAVDGGGLVSDRLELEADPGELVVGWAVLPELPNGVETVDVRMMRGSVVPNVPVEEGPLEPMVEAPAPLLGQGWPTLPDDSVIARADQDEATVQLSRRTGNVDDSVETAESEEDVTVTLDANVLFAKNSADLSDAASADLEEVAQDIAARGAGEVVITGHTDSDGPSGENQQLSERRADAVLDVLEPVAGGKVTFTARGEGESNPVQSNSTEEGQQANRRVTIEYTVEGEA